MTRTVVSVFAGAVIGAYLVLAVIDRPEPTRRATPWPPPACPEAQLRPVAAPVPAGRPEPEPAPLALDAAAALGSEFERRHALYSIAAAADLPGLQRLVFDSVRIPDPVARRDARHVVFTRLAATDPRSAISLAKLAETGADREDLRISWHAWGTRDLDEALTAVAALSDPFDRELAIQALYESQAGAHGGMWSKIKTMTNAEPDGRSRWQHMSRLAEASPQAAIDYTARLDDRHSRYVAVYQLAHKLVRDTGVEALDIADLFADDKSREDYLHVAMREIGRIDKAAAIEAMGSLSSSVSGERLVFRLVRELAGDDIDATLRIADRFADPQLRDYTYYALVQRLARRDAERAAALAEQIADINLRKKASSYVRHARQMDGDG